MREKRGYVGAAVIFLCIAVFVSACGGAHGRFSSAENLTARYRTGAAEPADGAAITQEFCRAYTDFSLNLLKGSRTAQGEEKQDVLISPLSVLLALEMARNGAEGDTLAQMDAVLYPGILAEQGKEGLLAFSANLPGADKARLHLADSVWFRAGDEFTPDETFLKTCAQEYGAEVYRAPFDDGTCSDINRWVERETDGEIREILDQIPGDAILYLVNALAFEAEWREIYESDQIQDREFTWEDGTTAKVPMMYSEESRYLSGEHAKGFVKPYESGYSFVALLPDEGMSLEEYLGGLDGKSFLQTIADGADRETVAGLPKFESGMRAELSELLSALGMPLAFDEVQADFTGMGSVGEGLNICISRVLHASHIAVDERGTKAGAATVVEMSGEGAAEAQPETVILNRPFLYAVVENETGLPVFIGTAEYLGR